MSKCVLFVFVHELQLMSGLMKFRSGGCMIQLSHDDEIYFSMSKRYIDIYFDRKIAKIRRLWDPWILMMYILALVIQNCLLRS